MLPELVWALLAGIAVALVASRIASSMNRKPIQAIPDQAGFGNREARVTIIFRDGTTRDTTWGEIEQKVKEINGERFWEKYRSDIVNVICALLGVAATLLVYWLQL